MNNITYILKIQILGTYDFCFLILTMIISKMFGIQRMEWERINIATMVILILATINSLRLRFTRLDGANGAARLVRVDEFPVHKQKKLPTSPISFNGTFLEFGF